MATPVTADTEGLKVLRYNPSVNVDIAPNLSITFSKPMVPLTSHNALAELSLPVSLDPQPAGEWYWLGTQTLLFQPERRLPGSTQYRVEIPAGVTAVDKSSLAETVRWEFATARLRLVETWPAAGQSVGMRPYMVLVFDRIRRDS